MITAHLTSMKIHRSLFIYVILCSYLDFIFNSAITLDYHKRPLNSTYENQDCELTCTTECRDLCIIQCSSNVFKKHEIFEIPGYQIIPLSCSELCQFKCIQTVANYNKLNGFKPKKYNGHWIFIRYFGLEEPASSIFSIFNSMPHIQYIYWAYQQRFIHKYRHTDDQDDNDTVQVVHKESLDTYYMSNWILCYAICSSVCWLCSALYHAKRIPLYAFLDYFTAFLCLFMNCFIALRRSMNVAAKYRTIYFLFSIFTLCYIIYIYAMLSGMITFDNHMLICYVLSFITIIIYIIWTLFLIKYEYEIIHYIIPNANNNIIECNVPPVATTVRNTVEQRHYIQVLCITCQIWFMLASTFEIFDFSPIFDIFDAHSLW